MKRSAILGRVKTPEYSASRRHFGAIKKCGIPVQAFSREARTSCHFERSEKSDIGIVKQHDAAIGFLSSVEMTVELDQVLVFALGAQ
jgi:hypothetical protein